ncbi:hypothetical protein V5799_024575 [Amblyomma americanum]|uniref:Uncharacterized protein n=1 Tax=Amblyomma americanum TaxID=6943 RepID=A0AAQ4EC63_AMBAM
MALRSLPARPSGPAAVLAGGIVAAISWAETSQKGSMPLSAGSGTSTRGDAGPSIASTQESKKDSGLALPSVNSRAP